MEQTSLARENVAVSDIAVPLSDFAGVRISYYLIR